MATNKKITELTEISAAQIADDDVFPLVDVSAGETKKASIQALLDTISGVSSLTASSPIVASASTGAVALSLSTVPVASGGTGATTAGAARTALSAAASGANSDITDLSGITGTIASPKIINWDTTGGETGGVAGRLKWNSTDLTLDLGVNDGSVTLQLGQENHTPARNNTGTSIADFRVVRLTGSQANRVTIALAQANSAANVTNVYGVTTQSIANNATGIVTTYGLINGVDTSGFTEGDTLYLSAATAGIITNVAPSSPNYRTEVGVCVTSHASTGRILVTVRKPQSLDTLTGDTSVSSATNGDILGFNSSGLWANQAATGTGSPVRATSPTLVTPALGTPTALVLTNATGLPVAGGGTGTTTSTGTGSVVLSTSPTLVTPALGTPSAAVLTNATGLPVSTGVSGLGSGVAAFLATPSSANLAAAVSDETGTGALVFATNPALVGYTVNTASGVDGEWTTSGLTIYGNGVTPQHDAALHVIKGTAGTWTSDSGAALVVESNTDGGLYLGVPDASTATIGFSSPTKTGANGALIQWGYTDGIMRFRTLKAGASMYFATGNDATALTLDSSQRMIALTTYSTTVGATNRDLYIDNTGMIGYVSSLGASKTEVLPITDTTWLHDLAPVSFKYRRKNEAGAYTGETDGDIQYGLLAEDVAAVRPDLCFYDDVPDFDESGEKTGTTHQELRGVQYSKLIPVLLRAVQELKTEVNSLKAR